MRYSFNEDLVVHDVLLSLPFLMQSCTNLVVIIEGARGRIYLY